MHPNTLRNKLSGVVAFPVTPFKDDLSLDLPGLHKNLNKLLEYPISAIVAAGGTGENYSLTPAEYLRVIELTALAVEDRVPVIAGVGFGQRVAIEMVQAAVRSALRRNAPDYQTSSGSPPTRSQLASRKLRKGDYRVRITVGRGKGRVVTTLVSRRV